MATNTLYLRSGNSIVFPASGDWVFILSVHALWQSPGVYDLFVEGISNGASACNVNLLLRSGPLSTSPALNTSGFFTAKFVGISLAAGDFIAIEAVNTATGAVGKDGFLLSFPHEETLRLPKASTASLQPERFDYLAGNPDRIVDTRFFNQLVLEPMLFTGKPTKKKAVLGRKEQDIAVKEFDTFIEEGKKVLRPIWREFTSGKIRYPQYLSKAREELKKPDRAATRKPSAEEKASWISRFKAKKTKKALKYAVKKKKGTGLPYIESAGDTLYLGFDSDPIRETGVVNDPRTHDLEEALYYWAAHDDFGGRVGLLFSDRLRFQSAGIVIGEPIYTMSLSPGEEVELRQVVETKRKSTLEDIIDREQELSLNLTASWTNEITEGLSAQSSIQNAVHVGADADVKLPNEQLPIGFGVNVSNDITVADTITREHSTKTAFERTANAASRMRSQHKIRMEVTNELSNSLSTTRKIRNANSQRSQTHIFSKVYRKERVTLERHDVQLCFRLVVNDPSLEARSNFIVNFDKFDPNNDAHYSESPEAITASEIFTSKYFDYPGSYSSKTYLNAIDLRSELKVSDGSSVPSGHILSGSRLSLVDFEIDEYDATPLSYTSNLKTYTSKSDFQAHGGKFYWDKEPETGGNSGKGILATTLTHNWSNYFIYEHGWIMRSARIKVEADWVPTQADLDAVRAANVTRRQDLIAVCTEERIRQIRDNAIADYPGQALTAAVSQQLAQTQNMVHLRHIFDFENTIVESAPYWSSESGLAAYRSLEDRLLNLPIPLAVSAILTQELTAPQAIVYIPIFSGHEAEALDLLSGVNRFEKKRILDDMEGYRNTKFADIKTTLPKFDEILGPTPLKGTPSGDTGWASEWEKPQKKFEVMAHWQLLTPTDGVHLETRLSDSVATDEHQTRMLENQTGG